MKVFLCLLKKYDMGKVEGYGWPVIGPIIRVLIKEVFPPGVRIKTEDGGYRYETSVRLWYEKYTHGQDYVLDFLASIGLHIHVETFSNSSLYRLGSSESKQSAITYQETKHLMNITI